MPLLLDTHLCLLSALRQGWCVRWHDNFHALVDTMMVEGFREAGVAEGDLASMTKIGAFVVKGLLMHSHDAQDRRAIIGLLTQPR